MVNLTAIKPKDTDITAARQQAQVWGEEEFVLLAKNLNIEDADAREIFRQADRSDDGDGVIRGQAEFDEAASLIHEHAGSDASLEETKTYMVEWAQSWTENTNETGGEADPGAQADGVQSDPGAQADGVQSDPGAQADDVQTDPFAAIDSVNIAIPQGADVTASPVTVTPKPGQAALLTSSTASPGGKPDEISYEEVTKSLGYKPKRLTIDGNVNVTGVPDGVKIYRTNAEESSTDPMDRRAQADSRHSNTSQYSTFVDPESRTVTTTVKIYAKPTEDVNPAELEQKKKLWEDEIDAAYDSSNTGIVYQDEDGNEWSGNFNVEFVDTPEEADLTIGVWDDPNYSTTTSVWAIDQHPGTAAHEFGHYLGALDHYNDDGSVDEGYEHDYMGHTFARGAAVQPNQLRGVAAAASLSSGHVFTPTHTSTESELGLAPTGAIAAGEPFDISVGPRGSVVAVDLHENSNGVFTGLGVRGHTADNIEINEQAGSSPPDGQTNSLVLESGEEINEVVYGSDDDGNVVFVKIKTSNGREVSAGDKNSVASMWVSTAEDGSAVSGFQGTSGHRIHSFGTVFGLESTNAQVNRVWAGQGLSTADAYE
mgnify:CR=1 FL=1